jgi:L-iditol 2-dehydrogenase
MQTKILGAFAEYIVIPAHIVIQNLFHKPEGLSFEEAAWMEPLACVVHSMSSVTIHKGDMVLIVGAGPIGLLHLLLAKQNGAKVIISGLEHDRLELAKSLGADFAIPPSMLADTVKDATDGFGVDSVFECTGQTEVWEQSVDYVRSGGTVVLFGGCKQGTTVSYDTYRIHYSEISLKGIFHFTPDNVKEAHRLLTDRLIDVRPLTSGIYPLEEIREAFEKLSYGQGIKYVIAP